MKRNLFFIVAIAQLLLFAGCTYVPKDLTGQTLAPTSPDQVTLYQKKPSHYGVVGTVTLEITPDLSWDERGQADKAFDLMKAKAAAKGANGILFEIDPSQFDVRATAGYGGKYYQVPIRLQPTKTAIATAILIENN